MAEIPTNAVQDVVVNGGSLPEMFTRSAACNNPLLEENDAVAVVEWRDCPVIDFSLLSSPQELTKLHSALLSWGSFQLINHGMREELLDEVRKGSKEFFVLPREERIKYSRTPTDPEGYGNDTVLSQNVPHNWNDRLFLTVHPKLHRKLHLWPQSPPHFRTMLEEFTMRVKGVHEKLVEAMARNLGLEEKCLTQEYGDEVVMTTRINYYPQCPVPELVHASRAHSDASAVTILLQDSQVDGLQVFRDDAWFKVPIIPHALFVNVGDQLEIMSNGIYKSAVHRVVANPERERLSVAMFCSPSVEKEIGPIQKLVNADRPKLYQTIKSYNKIFFKYHPNGQRPIEAVKINY